MKAAILLLGLLSGCAARRNQVVQQFVTPECVKVTLAEPCPLGLDGKLHQCKIKTEVFCIRIKEKEQQ